jgi:thiol:disulfide interchange protein
LNTSDVKAFVEKNGVVAIRADKTRTSPEIDKLLVELGNTGRGIPFLAIYPGDGGAPILFDGPVTKQMVLDALADAGPSSSPPPEDKTAMK